MAVTLTNSQLSAGLYSAFWNRAPDATGQNFWVGKLNGGVSTLAVATEFYNAPEGLGAYPNGMRMDKAALITEVYNSVFNRAPDLGGLAFWTAQLTTDAKGVVSNFPQVVLNMMQSAVDSAAAGNTDGMQFLNEIQVGIYVSEVLRTDDPAITSIAFEGVTYEESSVAIREAQLNAMVNVGETYTLDTGFNSITGTPLNDTFNAMLDVGAMTLNAGDSLNGNGGIDTLNVQINAAVTPLALNEIEIVNIQSSNAASSLNLVNAPDVTSVVNNSSSDDLVVTGIAANAALTVQNVDGDATTFEYANTDGTADVANLTINSVTGGAVIQIADIETLNVASSGSVANSVNLNAAAATTVNISGANALTLTTAPVVATTINGTTMTGALTAGLNVAGSLTGGSGSDSLTGSANNDVITGNAGNDTITAGAGEDNLSGGAGNDLFVLAGNLTTADTINGGTDFDTLSANLAQLTAYAAVTPATISNIEAITVADAALNANLTLSNLQAGINTVNLTDGANAGTVTFDSGVNGTVNIAAANAGSLTVVSAGSGTIDALTIANTAATKTDVLNGKNVVATGVETLTLNLGGVSQDQAVGTITGTSGTTAVVINGNNNVSTGIITAGSVNASGLTGTAALTIGAATVGVTSITGSANGDTLVGSATATTIYGGAGNDIISGGAAADVLHGEEGNDTITSGAGNDTIHGGAGNDTITVTTGTINNVSIDAGEGNDTVDVTNTLAVGDVIDGGTGINTLAMSTALVAPYANVTNFQTLQLNAAAAFSQNLANFTGTTLDTLSLNGVQNYTISGASANLANLNTLTDTGTSTFARATDTSADALAIYMSKDTTTTSLTANNEETITVQGLGTSGITTLAGDDLTTLNVSGVTGSAFGIGTLTAAAIETITITNAGTTNIAGGTLTALSTINASGAAGNIVVNATSGTDNITFTGGSGTASVTTGSGNDTLTGSATAANTLVGVAGNDTITGGAVADSVTGGTGGDTFYLATGGNDTIIYTAAAETYSGDVTSGTTSLAAVDVVNGSSVADIFSIYAAAGITGATAVSTSLITAGTVDTIAVVRGGYNSLTGIWTSSTSGSDVAVQWDSNGSTAGGAIETVILVGVGGTVTTATTGANAFTLA